LRGLVLVGVRVWLLEVIQILQALLENLLLSVLVLAVVDESRRRVGRDGILILHLFALSLSHLLATLPAHDGNLDGHGCSSLCQESRVPTPISLLLKN
jgi:hypothetical protein